MVLTEFEYNFKTALLNITKDIDFIYAHYLAARNDECRQEIIDGINNGTLKTMDDISEITKKMSPVYKAWKNN